METDVAVSAEKQEWIRERVLRLTGEPIPAGYRVWDDTTNYMSIERGHVIDLAGDLFLVRSDEHEGRFSIDDQPKFWVKHAIGLATGRTHILKLVFQEEFRIHVGEREVHCRRSAEKEARVLELVRGDARFMQGRTVTDVRGNRVRVIDFIRGTDLLNYVQSISLTHRQYSQALLPRVLAAVAAGLRGIHRLHEAGLCHGDIRNDHLLIERETGLYKWIDFDLEEDSPAFDVWSAGNILHCVAGKGFVTFHEAIQARPELASQLWREDGSVFFPHRVMNLRKVFPHLPEMLNRVLCRFSSGCRTPNETMEQIAADLEDCAAAEGWGWSA